MNLNPLNLDHFKVTTPPEVKAPKHVAPLVAGGDIKWKPIDRTAAKMIAKSPWIHMPISGPDQPTIRSEPDPVEKPKKERVYMITKTIDQIERIANGAASTDEAEEAGTALALNLLKDARRASALSAETLTHSADLMKSLANQAETMDEAVAKFKNSSHAYIEQIRTTKYAVASEVNQIIAPLREIRQFFMGRDYDQEIARLRDFVELCERLQKLKESGFLDRVADTMIRLA